MTAPEHARPIEPTEVCPVCRPALWAGYTFHPVTYNDLLCPEHKPEHEPEWMLALRDEIAAREAATAAVIATLPPIHPTRGCTAHRDLTWCGVCGWPDTHHLPAATLTGIIP
jgi:hypothetical protein